MNKIIEFLVFLYPLGIYLVGMVVFLMATMRFKGGINTPLREVLFLVVTSINVFFLGCFESIAEELGNDNHATMAFVLMIFFIVIAICPSPRKNENIIR